MHDDDEVEEVIPLLNRELLRDALSDAIRYYRKQIRDHQDNSASDRAWNAANQIIQAAPILAALDYKPGPEENQWQ